MHLYRPFLMLSLISSSALGANPIDEMAEMFQTSFPTQDCLVKNIEVLGMEPNRVLSLELSSPTYKGLLEFSESINQSDYKIEEGVERSGVPYWRISGEFRTDGNSIGPFQAERLFWEVDLERGQNLDFVLEGRTIGGDTVVDCSES